MVARALYFPVKGPNVRSLLFVAAIAVAAAVGIRSSPSEDVAERFSIYYGLRAGSTMRGELAALLETAEAISHEVGSRPESPEAVVAHRLSGMTNWYVGNFIEGRAQLERALAIFDPECRLINGTLVRFAADSHSPRPILARVPSDNLVPVEHKAAAAVGKPLRVEGEDIRGTGADNSPAVEAGDCSQWRFQRSRPRRRRRECPSLPRSRNSRRLHQLGRRAPLNQRSQHSQAQ